MSKIEVNAVEPQCGTTLTLGASGDTVTLGSGASQSGFGRTGTVDWDTTPKTATFSSVSGEGYFCNTTSSAFTVNLPAGSAGAIVSLADYAATWQTNNLTVSPNGTDKIGGGNADVILNTEGQSVTFVYVDSTQGWINVQDSTSNVRVNEFIVATGGTITTSGNCKIHTFTGPGTFTVCNVAIPANNKLAYLVVAGGAGSSHSPTNSSGGSGAGGFREGRCNPVTPYTASPLVTTGLTATIASFPITVGGGGAGGSPPSPRGSNGNNSVFSTITSTGGGAGGAQVSGPVSDGVAGGSGGGSAYRCGGATGGAGNTPPVSPPQGNAGGSTAPGGDSAAGGGGGATAVGGDSPQAAPSTVGNGGAGATTSISGSPTAYAGGGGGSNNGASPNGIGGAGGGGNGAPSPQVPGVANTGGGAGGVANNVGGPYASAAAGGSGIVIIRYKYQ